MSCRDCKTIEHLKQYIQTLELQNKAFIEAYTKQDYTKHVKLFVVKSAEKSLKIKL
jgi:uncharacterized protein YeeX (DUF496 family)